MIEIRAVIYKGDIRDYGPGYLAVVPALEDCYAYAKTYEGAVPYSKQEVVVSYDNEAKRKLPDWAIVSWIGIAVWVVPMVYKSELSIMDKIPAALGFIGSLFLIYLLITTGTWIYRKLKKH